jgi:hypothetical protein
MPSASEATAQLRAAAKQGDADLVMSAFGPSIVVRSPLTERVAFRGPTEVRRLFDAVYANVHNIDYHTELGDEHTRALFGTAIVRGQHIEETLLLRLDETAKVTDLTLFVRPLPGLTALMAALGPDVARRFGRSWLTATTLTTMIKPLEFATRFGDRAGMRLAIPRTRT